MLWPSDATTPTALTRSVLDASFAGTEHSGLCDSSSGPLSVMSYVYVKICVNIPAASTFGSHHARTERLLGVIPSCDFYCAIWMSL